MARDFERVHRTAGESQLLSEIAAAHVVEQITTTPCKVIENDESWKE
jgi:hypothetical protein